MLPTSMPIALTVSLNSKTCNESKVQTLKPSSPEAYRTSQRGPLLQLARQECLGRGNWLGLELKLRNLNVWVAGEGLGFNRTLTNGCSKIKCLASLSPKP